MAYEMRELSGSLFKNDRRESDNHPNAKGSALIGGVEYWVSAWTKTDKNGNRWQSLSFQPKDNAQSKPATQTGYAAGSGYDDGSDIPFAAHERGWIV